MYLSPGPQRENACGLFIPGFVCTGCKNEKEHGRHRDRVSTSGSFFEDAEAHPKVLRAVGVP